MLRFSKGRFLVFLAVALVACPLGSHAQPSTTNEVNKLALKLYGELTAEDSSSNVFFSPFSIAAAFAPLYLGAGGNTRAQLDDAFGFGAESVTDTLLSPQSLVQSDDADIELLLGNKIYVQQGYELKPEFEDKITGANAFDALDFTADPKGSLETINSFVETATNGNIPKLLPDGSVDSMTRLVVANTIFFAGKWTSEFDPDLTTPKEFKSFGGTPFVKVEMMKQKDTKFRTNSQGIFSNVTQILELPYGDESISMLVILPKKDDEEGFKEVERLLQGMDLAEVLDNLTDSKVNINLPRFEVEQEANLIELLPKLGVTDIFDEMRANLSRISDEPLHVSTAIHKAKVKTDEKGTVGAAATGAVAGPRNFIVPEDFIADRPFVYLIVDKSVNVILFMGNIRQIEPAPQN